MKRLGKLLDHVGSASNELATELRTQDCTAVERPHKGKKVGPPLFGGRLAAQALKEQGVRFVFTLTGGWLHCETFTKFQQKKKKKIVIDVRDEVTTVFAADAQARVSGIPGVAIVTAGPGLTNTITAVKNAQMAESPVVVFGGATSMLLKGRGSLQDINQFALMKPHTKWCHSIKQVKEIIPTIRKAFHIAKSGVPGPVFIEWPLETIWPREMMSDLTAKDE
ncbi:thiamine pyrophosphate-binding enzyme family protein, partial [Reticulomyxa filosa]